jgi:hypothetical protein
MILLGVNLILFCLTSVHLWRQRREARRVFTDGVNSVQGRQDVDCIKMYLKLFLLMAITSVTLIIDMVSWAFESSRTNNTLWFGVICTIHYLRGPLIFWFCIWSRKNVRKAFHSAFICRRKTAEVQQTKLVDLSSMGASISVTNASRVT